MIKRGSLLVGGLVLALATTILLIRASGASDAPEAAPALGAVASTASVRSPQLAGPELPLGGEDGCRLCVSADASWPLVDVREALGTARADERPLVARGCVSWAGGRLPEQIDVVLYGADGRELERTTTAQAGSFELCWGEPLAQGWSMVADAAVFASNDTLVAYALGSAEDLPQHMPADPAVEVELALGFLPRITGRVFDRVTGAAIAAAEIVASSEQPAWTLSECSALSQADGSYRLELDDLPARGLIVWCRVDGWQTRLAGPQDLELAHAPGQNLIVDFALDRPAPWSGRVVSALDGSPVAGATITVGNDLAAFSDSSDSEVSDADGCFELELPEVPIEHAWVHVAAPSFGPLALRSLRPGCDLRIALDQPITLVGTVTERGCDLPIEGASVQIAFDGETLACDYGLYDEASTDANGGFEVGLEFAPAGTARITVEAPGYVLYEAQLADIAAFTESGKRMVRVGLDALR